VSLLPLQRTDKDPVSLLQSLWRFSSAEEQAKGRENELAALQALVAMRV
jgi:hypothetical protein